MPPSHVPIFSAPVGRRKLTPAQWRAIEKHLDDWKAEVLAAAKRHPAKSYRLGMAQVEAFADLLADLHTTAPAGGAFGGVSASMEHGAEWARTYTLRELDDALNVYIGRIKDALLHGLRGALNPTQVAAAMYKATRDASINWRMIARTEMVRANAEGRLAAIAAMGYDQVWCPPHIGACRWCRNVLEGKVFRLADVQGKTNFARKPGEYVACIPLHPQCRHSWLPYDPDVYREAMAQYARMEAAGLTDEKRLDELFDSSGQLKPGVDPALFDAAKRFDPYVEGLAAVVDVLKHRAYHPARELVLPWQLRSDTHQRPVDAANVQAIAAAILAGQVMPPIQVTRWPTGAMWVTNGQHRLAAHRELFGDDTPIEALVVDRDPRTDSTEATRAVVGKALTVDVDAELALELIVAKAVTLDGAIAATAPLDGDAAADSAPDPEPFGAAPALDPLVWDGARLRDDVALALETWWASIAGDTWREYSRLLMPVHGAPTVAVDYDALRAARPEYSKLPDTDLHFALVLAARQAGAEIRELAPGVPMDLRIAPAPELVPSGIAPTWDLHLQEWMGGAIPDVALKTVADVFPDYVWKSAAVAELPNTATRLLGSDEYEALVAKANKVDTANVGVEHWITIHPHGDEEKGQPVLVRNGADGTMTVIGGAGGNLNMMRLDPSRRVDRDDATGKPKGATGAARDDGPEQAVTDEEQERMDAEREQQVQAAHEALERAKADRQATVGQMEDFAREQLGVDFGELDPAAKRKMLKKLRVSALRTLAYGPVAQRDVADSADADQLGLPREQAEAADRDARDPELADAATPEDGDTPERTPRPQVALSEEQARAWLDFHHQQQALSKIAGAQRRIIAGEATAADANQIDWSLGGQAKLDEQRAAKAAALIRTDLTRSALEHGDTYYDGKKWNTKYRQSFQQGAYDTVDAFSHSILGESQISKAGADLLGVSGAAQLVAHAIQQQMAGRDLGALGGDGGVQGALKALTDDRERVVNERGLARVKQSIERAAQATQEVTKSEQGESLYTTTMARSIASTQVASARTQLAGMIGGLEAASALKQALDRKPGEKIKVGGFATPSDIKKACEKARVKVRPSEIKKVGAGNYVLSIDPDRLMGLVRPAGKGDTELRARLEQIRTGEGLDAEIEDARRGHGMSDVLDRNQAKGKLFLRAAGSGVLAFDPGVGKTHTALGAAMEVMHDAGQQPGDGAGKHKALIVAPTNMLHSWANTIRDQHGGHTVAVVGERDSDSTAKKKATLDGDADFTIVSYESLKSYQDVLKKRHAEGRSHSIVIADELQKAKNEATANHQGVETAVKHAAAQHGTDTHFWGLTGTPVEKSVTDVHAMQRLAHLAKGKNPTERAAYRAKYKDLGQREHIARGDRIRQFRQGLDEDLFRLKARDAGNELAEPDRHTHAVKLDDEHRAEYQERVKRINQVIAEDNAKARAGELPLDKNGRPKRRIQFGGRDALMDALYGRENSAIAHSVADEISKTGTFEHKGGTYNLGVDEHGHPIADPSDHAGTYEHKHVVFGSNETSRALFGTKEGGGGFDPKAQGGLAKILRDRGVKVFVGHGSMGSAANEASYKAFLAHGGKAVFLTNDKNNAGISLQFGDNKGRFQHGATHMHHFTVPVNNATIQQREARILRKGAESKVAYHDYDAGTPIEQKLRETLAGELRTQDLAANSEQLVSTGGEDDAKTLAHHLADRGIKQS